MEFIETFGLNPVLLLAQIVNFLILVYLLNRFLYKPVLSVLKTRQEKIEKGLEDAKKSEEFLEKAKIEYQQTLKQATDEAQKIYNDARENAEELRSLFEEQAKREKDQILREGREKLLGERVLMEKELMSKVLRVASEVVEKTLSVVLSGEDKKRIEQNVLKRLPG